MFPYLSTAIRHGKRRDFPLKNNIKKVFDNSWIEFIFRWILGITFIYASYSKIISPGDFAKIIYGYALFPEVTINFIAIILPFIELVSGLALIIGIYPRSAVLIVNGMLVAFIILLSVNLMRGHEFTCGCFSVKETGYIHAPGRWIARDIIYFLLGLQVFLYDGSRKGSVDRFYNETGIEAHATR